MPLNKFFTQQESQVTVDTEFLKTLRRQLIEQQATEPTTQPTWRWWPALALASATLGVALAITLFPRTTPLTPQVAFAAAFENTFGTSLTDFFFTHEGRHMQWQVIRSGQLEGTADLWKIDGRLRFRFNEHLTTYDSLRLDDQQCAYAADRSHQGEIACQNIDDLVAQNAAQLESTFLPTTLTLEPKITSATDTTHNVEGWVISWETAQPYVLTGGDTMESWANVDEAHIVYAEGPRAYGEYRISEAANPNVIHSMFDVVNEPTDTGYRHAGFLGASQNNLIHGLTFQIVENGAASNLYHFTVDGDLEQITDREQLFAQLAVEDAYSLPIDSRMFEALHVARDMEAFTTPLEQRTEELNGRNVTYYRFADPTRRGEFANSWKKTILLDGPAQMFEFWVDEALGKIIKYRVSSVTGDSSESQIDRWEATLITDESYAEPLTYSTWSEEVR